MAVRAGACVRAGWELGTAGGTGAVQTLVSNLAGLFHFTAGPEAQPDPAGGSAGSPRLALLPDLAPRRSQRASSVSARDRTEHRTRPGAAAGAGAAGAEPGEAAGVV